MAHKNNTQALKVFTTTNEEGLRLKDYHVEYGMIKDKASGLMVENPHRIANIFICGKKINVNNIGGNDIISILDTYLHDVNIKDLNKNTIKENSSEYDTVQKLREQEIADYITSGKSFFDIIDIMIDNYGLSQKMILDFMIFDCEYPKTRMDINDLKKSNQIVWKNGKALQECTIRRIYCKFYNKEYHLAQDYKNYTNDFIKEYYTKLKEWSRL